MDTNGYQENNVAIEQEENLTKISIRTQVQEDEQVNLLSQGIQETLLKK